MYKLEVGDHAIAEQIPPVGCVECATKEVTTCVSVSFCDSCPPCIIVIPNMYVVDTTPKIFTNS